MKSHITAEEAPLLPNPPFTPSSLTSTLKGYLLLLISAIVYPMVSLLTRYAETEYSYPTTTALIIRSIITSTLTASFVSRLPPSAFRLSRIQIIQLASTVALGAFHYAFMYSALIYSPLGIFITLQAVSTPLAAFFGAIFLGEAVRKSEVIALGVSALGVVLIAHPAKDDFKSILGVILSTASALTTPFMCVLLRAMGEVHFLLPILGSSLLIGLQSIFFTSSSDWSAILENRTGTLLISIASLGAFTSMTTFTPGIKMCRAGPGMLVATISIPVSFAFGWFFLSESLHWFTMIGAALVICSAGLVAGQAILDERQGSEMFGN